MVRYLLATVGLSIGVWRDSLLLSVLLAVVGVLVSALVAHPADAVGFLGRRRAYRAYLAEVRAVHGERVDLGDSPEMWQSALAGAIRPFRVFVSSTFLDLAGERDRLAKEVFPRIGRECERRGALWAPIDLRWGITDFQQNAMGVTHLCLDSVERSRPNAIGIVGSRYGTRILYEEAEVDRFPKHLTSAGTDVSLTHLELRHAAHADPAGATVFALETERDADDAARLDAMLQELRSAGVHVIEGVPDSDRLLGLIEHDLLRRLDKQVPDSGLANQVLREISAHRMHEERLATRPRLNETVLTQTWAALSEKRVPVLRGAAGSGRSTLLASCAHEFRAANPRAVTICRFVGLTEFSRTWPDLVRSIAVEIAVRTGRTIRLPANDLELPMALSRLVTAIQAERCVSLFIDGLDLLRTPAGEEEYVGRSLSWAPQQGESVRMEFVPTVATDDLDPQAFHVDICRDVRIPSLGYADRLSMVIASLKLVDRQLPPADVDSIAEHPCSGDPAFMALLLNELHAVPAHHRLSTALTNTVAAASVDELVAFSLERITDELDERRAAQVSTLLAVLTSHPAGLTSAAVVDLVGAVRGDFTQADLLLLRDRLSALVVEVEDSLRVVSCLASPVRSQVATADLITRVRQASVLYFTDESRRFNTRSVSQLVGLGLEVDVLHELRALLSYPRGLVALRDAFGVFYSDALASVARETNTRVAALVLGGAAAATELDNDTRLSVAEICLDHRLVTEAQRLAATINWDEISHDPDLSNRALAIAGKASLRGGQPLTVPEWQFILDHAMSTRSANVHLAMSGLGAILGRRGDAYWAGKYFDRALDVAFACGDVAGTAATAANAALSAILDGDEGLLDRVALQLRKTFAEAVQAGVSIGNIDVVVLNLFRRGAMDLRLGDPAAALDGFQRVGRLAASRDDQHFLRLADLGQALSLVMLGHAKDSDRLAARHGLSLNGAAAAVDAELRTVTL